MSRALLLLLIACFNTQTITYNVHGAMLEEEEKGKAGGEETKAVRSADSGRMFQFFHLKSALVDSAQIEDGRNQEDTHNKKQGFLDPSNSYVPPSASPAHDPFIIPLPEEVFMGQDERWTVRFAGLLVEFLVS